MPGIEDSELKARELRLREEQLRLDQEKFQASQKASVLDWVRGLGLPIASLIASLFFFGVQQQQQAFDRAVSNVRDGLRLYYDRLFEIDGVKTLDSPDKIAAARDVLVSTSKIYPEVFCAARSDLMERITAAPMSLDRQEQARRMILEVQPERTERGLATPRWAIVSNVFEPRMPDCPSPKGEPVVAPPEASADAGDAAASAPVATDAPAAEPAPTDLAARSAAPSIVATAPLPKAAPLRAQRLYRVFAQVGPGTPREVVDPWRAEAADAGFGIVRGVEQVRTDFGAASVRYNGRGKDAAVVAADAANLAAWLEDKIGRPVEVIDVGARYPGMRDDTLEIWIPDAGPSSPP